MCIMLKNWLSCLLICNTSFFSSVSLPSKYGGVVGDLYTKTTMDAKSLPGVSPYYGLATGYSKSFQQLMKDLGNSKSKYVRMLVNLYLSNILVYFNSNNIITKLKYLHAPEALYGKVFHMMQEQICVKVIVFSCFFLVIEFLAGRRKNY